MTTLSSIAQRLLDENNYAGGSPSLTVTEYLIDNAIDFVNLEAGINIASLSGTAESKTISGSNAEILAVKTVASLLIRGYKEKGPNVQVGPLGVTSILSDPHYDFFNKLWPRILNRLQTRDTTIIR